MNEQEMKDGAISVLAAYLVNLMGGEVIITKEDFDTVPGDSLEIELDKNTRTIKAYIK